MIRKFATASEKIASQKTLPILAYLILILLFTVPALAQSTSPDQTPATQPAQQDSSAQQPAAAPPAQQPATQEPASDEESISHRRKPCDYKKWSYNVGAGANLDSGTTHDYVRGGGFVGGLGVARNGNKYLGLRVDAMYADLPLRDRTLINAQATGATSYAIAGTLDPIINFSVTKNWGGYVLFGPAFFHRTGTLDGDTTVPGSPCSPFWVWWGACSVGSVPISGNFTSESQNEWGYNFGGGVTRKTPSGVEVYAEFRFMHGSGNNVTTDFRPITIGFRW